MSLYDATIQNEEGYDDVFLVHLENEEEEALFYKHAYSELFKDEDITDDDVYYYIMSDEDAPEEGSEFYDDSEEWFRVEEIR